MSDLYEKIQVIREQWKPSIACSWTIDVSPSGLLRVYATDGPLGIASVEVDWPLSNTFLATLDEKVTRQLKARSDSNGVEQPNLVAEGKKTLMDTSSFGTDGFFLTSTGGVTDGRS